MKTGMGYLNWLTLPTSSSYSWIYRVCSWKPCLTGHTIPKDPEEWLVLSLKKLDIMAQVLAAGQGPWYQPLRFKRTPRPKGQKRFFLKKILPQSGTCQKKQVQNGSVEVGNTPLETGQFPIVLNLSELLDLLLGNKRQIKKYSTNVPMLS